MLSISDTAPIRPGEELDWRAAEAYLRHHIPSDCISEPDRQSALRVEQFPGGHSNLTYLLRFGAREFVLRRPPFGPVAPTAHDMPREFRVLSLVHPVFPLAPRPYFLCADPSILGAPFYLMERRRGFVIRREVPEQAAWLPDSPRRISETMVDRLADLHAVDIEASGSAAIGKPAGFVERQIRGWAERWERARTSEVPEMAALTRWLLDRIPEPSGAALVHNDFKLDNVMFDPAEPSRAVAILDWEMCTVGDPLVDLGLLLCYWPERGDPEARREWLSPVTTGDGWLGRGQLVERYAARTGRDVSAIGFYEAFALFKVAVVVQQIYFRYERGQTRDARFADFGRRVIGLIEAACRVAESSRASHDPN
ncbi:MAG: phosphotransferase family protein [Acidobacteria bacterium]|nr:MAG: phosphotransferase family protein [Acidobacteriota bacterium]